VGHIAEMDSKTTESQILKWFEKPETKEKGISLLIEIYQEPLYWHIRKMVLSHDDTKDILQEVFLRVWKNIGSFKGNSKLFTWLYQITTNEVSRFLDRKKRTLKKNEVLQEIMQTELENSPWISGDEIQMKLQKAILQLPRKQQLVFNMRYFDDMNYEDIAEILESSVESLKVSYHYACKKITVQLNNEII